MGPAPLAAPEVGGGVEGMEISEEKDFPAKILEISEEKDLPSSPLKEIVKTDAEKENVVGGADKVVNGKNGVLKLSNGSSSEVKETDSEAAVKTLEGKLSTDISNGEKVNGDVKPATTTVDDILPEHAILPSEQDTSQKENE